MPPVGPAKWHPLQLGVYRELQSNLDGQSKDDEFDFFEYSSLVTMDGLEKKETQATGQLPDALRERLIEANCTEVRTIGRSIYDSQNAPDLPVADEHGDNLQNATQIAVGEEVAIALNSSEDKDVLVFSAELGARYVIALGRTTSSRATEPTGPIMALYDAGGQELSSLDEVTFAQNEVAWRALTAGPIHIVVGDGATAGYFTVTVDQDDHGNDIDNATALSVDESTVGALESLDDFDVFVFQATESTIYEIDVTLGTLDDSIVALRNSRGWKERSNDNHGGTLGSRIVWRAPESEDYFIEVSGSDGTGTYILNIAVSDIGDDHGDDDDDATAVSIGDATGGALNYSGDRDVFVFEVTEGGYYQIDVTLGTLDASRVSLWTELEPLGIVAGSKDNHGDVLGPRIVVKTGAPGDHFVWVSGGTGTYTLSILAVSDPGDDHGDDDDGATEITARDAVAGVLEHPDDVDVFAFEAVEGELYQIDVTTDEDMGTLADTIVTLRDSDGSELGNVDALGEEPGSRIFLKAGASGDYFVEVSSGWFSAGSYTLNIAVIVDDHGDDIDSATAVSAIDATTGALDYLGDRDFFAFTAEEGKLYQIDVAWGTLDGTRVVLRDPDGSELRYNTNRSDALDVRIVWQAPMSGDYFVEVYDWGSDSIGTYTLNFDTAIAVSAGDASAGVLEYLDDRDFFAFEAVEGEVYQIGVALGTLDNSSLALLASIGAPLRSNDSHEGALGPRIVWEAQESRSHFIEVSGFGSTGTYTLNFDVIPDDHGEDIDSATALSLGDSTAGALEYSDDRDLFVFEAVEGTIYEIDVALDTLDDSIMTLKTSDNELAYNDDHGDVSGSKIVWRAAWTGEIFVEVFSWGGTGTYTLNIAVADVVADDHDDVAADATAIVVGDSVQGARDYFGDEDVFLLPIEAGTVYEIDLVLGTLDEANVVLYDEPDEWKSRFTSPVLSVEKQRNVLRSEYTGDSYLVVRFPGSWLGSYTLKVTKVTFAGTSNYDTDADGFIEVSNLKQLNAIRWDLDGDGLADGSFGIADYAAAFPDAADGMGCPEKRCSGYELVSDLDFDTNGNGSPDRDDAYWNNGQGWEPIGNSFYNRFSSSFDGGGHTISNLFIDRRYEVYDGQSYVGLFGNTDWDGTNRWVGLNNNISNIGLINVDIRGGNTDTGGLVGANGLVIAASYVTGRVSNNSSDVGGLVGSNFDGTIIASYSNVDVFGGGNVGGLVGSNFGGTITASYSTGTVKNSDTYGKSGGLVGSNSFDAGNVIYSYWDISTSGQSESAGGEGKTTNELQSPVGYTGIYENWDLDLDKDEVGDDLWDFGTADQYPRHRWTSAAVEPATPAETPTPAIPTPQASASTDDHGNDADTAAAVSIGESIDGVIDYDGDVDVFAFEAVEGELYQIDVSLGDLGDSVATLFDADGQELASNDDHDGTLASRIVWEAPSTGSYYVGAGGDGTGSYTLTVALSNTQGLTQLTDNSSTDSDPSWSPDGSKIAFSSDRDGDWDIYVMDADGSDIVQLTDNTGTDSDPSWSPDGSKIAFASDRDHDFEIYVMEADGSGVIQLTDNSGGDGNPAWSSDGSRIVFSSDRDGDWEISMMNTDGFGYVQLTANHDDDVEPSWSPVGGKIAFASYRDGDLEIYVMDGSDTMQLTDNSGVDGHPSWSRDGSKIAFLSDRDGDFEIYIMEADGSGITQLTDNSDGDVLPSWSPDGSKIAFISDRDGDWEIYVITVGG